MTLTGELMIGITIGAGIGFVAVVATQWQFNVRVKLAELQAFMLTMEGKLQAARVAAGAANAILFKLHNGGSNISATTPLYSSVICENVGDAKISVANEWQGIRVDFQYLNMLANVQKSGFVILHTEQMESSQLQRTYERMGVVTSAVFLVYARPGGSLYYASFPFCVNPNVTGNLGWLAPLETAVANMHNLCRQYDRKGMLE